MAEEISKKAWDWLKQKLIDIKSWANDTFVNKTNGIAPYSRITKRVAYYGTETRPTSPDWVSDGTSGGLLTTLLSSNMSNKPFEGTLLTLPWDWDGWHAQLAVKNSNDNKSPVLAHRFKNGSGTWSSWQYLPYYRIGDVIITSSNTNPSGTLGGTWTAMPKNYASYKYPNSIANGAWNHNLTITTSGGAVFLNMNGHINPLNAGGWVSLHIKRDGTEIASQTVQSQASSCNVPYSVTYIDVPSAGSHTYNFSMTVGSGTIQNNEGGATYTPQMMAFELGASTNMYFWKRTA